MWYEILPTCGIIIAGLALPQYVMPYVLEKVINNPMRRSILTPFARRMYLRDERLTDNPLAAGDIGLKNIPDN